MTDRPTPQSSCVAFNDELATAGSSPDAMASVDAALSRIESLGAENEALSRDLLRCYEQLSLVFEITEHIAVLHDPRQVQEALLGRYAAMLGVAAIFVDRPGSSLPVPLSIPGGAEIDIDAKDIAENLADEIEAVRASNRARVHVWQPSSVASPAGAVSEAGRSREGTGPPINILLDALRQFDADAAVVIAIRTADQQPFDSGDMMASESALGYGGHILSNLMMVRHLQEMAFETVGALVSAIDQKDNYTCGHAERVGWLATLTGKALELPESEIQKLEWSGLLHDVGKIGVPESILNKPGKLTHEEYEIMKRHPRMSYEVLKPVASLEPILGAVLYHHENHDGSGYPEGLAGNDIPLKARIIHVVDIFDALTSSRSYREGFTRERAFGILNEDAGRVTDPHMARAMSAREWQARFEELATEDE